MQEDLWRGMRNAQMQDEFLQLVRVNRVGVRVRARARANN